MEDFFTFYQYGGFFNHVVSLFALAALSAIVMHATGPQRGDLRLLRLTDRLGLLAIAAGVLGTLFNVIEMGAALATVDADLVTQATHRALTIVPIPLVWALLCAIPVWVATACLRHRVPAIAQ